MILYLILFGAHSPSVVVSWAWPRTLTLVPLQQMTGMAITPGTLASGNRSEGEAWDTAGNRTEQTLTRAYNLRNAR